jgi:uncharacterized protein YecE (DUF72 family)
VYATWCTAVEANTTFYALPDASTVARWRDRTPEVFRFVCKLPRTVTHDRRLRGAAAEVAEFCARLAPLRERLGPTVVQLPASFGPGDLPVLAAFLASLDPEWDWAVEVRHPAFFDGGPSGRDLNELLAGHGADRVVLDSRALFAGPASTPAEVEAFARKPRLPVRPIATAAHPIVRFIGQSDPEANPPFWEPWVATVARWLDEGREPVVFVHTPDNAVSPALARRFHAAVAARHPGAGSLPEPRRSDTPPSLFDHVPGPS